MLRALVVIETSTEDTWAPLFVLNANSNFFEEILSLIRRVAVEGKERAQIQHTAESSNYNNIESYIQHELSR